mmetsp:Transcript_9435/g.31351  ORF Transcript_9435/g.31351 Transcript_9435/m.31351 type:complete len:280 (-) Transcript_9435:1384-2223(-)
MHLEPALIGQVEQRDEAVCKRDIRQLRRRHLARQPTQRLPERDGARTIRPRLGLRVMQQLPHAALQPLDIHLLGHLCVANLDLLHLRRFLQQLKLAAAHAVNSHAVAYAAHRHFFADIARRRLVAEVIAHRRVVAAVAIRVPRILGGAVGDGISDAERRLAEDSSPPADRGRRLEEEGGENLWREVEVPGQRRDRQLLLGERGRCERRPFCVLVHSPQQGQHLLASVKVDGKLGLALAAAPACRTHGCSCSRGSRVAGRLRGGLELPMAGPSPALARLQ